MRGRAATASNAQLTLSLESALPERFTTLREFIAHRVQVHTRPAKSIAGDMDMAPSTLSRKLAPSEHDAQRFTVDDLERYMQVTADFSAIEYLASKYLQSDEARQARALARVEALAGDLDRALKDLRGGTR
jgi:hypothetical protein